MLLWIVTVFSIALFFGFPIFTLHVIRKTQKIASAEDKKNGYSELKASILFLQMAFPTILFLAGALGYGAYELIITRVTNSVQAKVDTLIERKRLLTGPTKSKIIE